MTFEPVDSVEIEYEKSNFCRVVHVNGAWGGITPNLEVRMALYSQKSAIPGVMTIEVVGSRLQEIPDAVTRYTREIEVEAMMSASTARTLAAWLIDKADQIDQVLALNAARMAAESEER